MHVCVHVPSVEEPILYACIDAMQACSVKHGNMAWQCGSMEHIEKVIFQFQPHLQQVKRADGGVIEETFWIVLLD